jgi:hypothetical protein
VSEEKKQEMVQIMENIDELRKINPEFVSGVLAGLEVARAAKGEENNGKDHD